MIQMWLSNIPDKYAQQIVQSTFMFFSKLNLKYSGLNLQQKPDFSHFSAVKSQSYQGFYEIIRQIKSWSDQQKHVFRLCDNKSAARAQWRNNELPKPTGNNEAPSLNSIIFNKKILYLISILFINLNAK